MHRAVKRAHRLDAVVAAVCFLVVFALGATFDLFERFGAFSRAYERFELDEALIALVAAVMGLLVYSYRRTIAFRREHAARLIVYRDLLREMNEAGMIRLALEQAERERTTAQRSKSAFLSHMSHEMRTPLNAIIGFAQMLGSETGAAGADKRHAYANHILDSGTHLLRTVDGILDLSDASGTGLTLNETEFDLCVLTRLCIAQCEPDATTKGVALIGEIPPTAHIVSADETRIRQAISHLIGNALKFTPEDGQVRVRIARAPDGGLVFRCTDTGLGMSASEIETAQQPFARPFGMQAKPVHRGTGVGLPLCGAIADNHDAALLIESREGAGTVVTLHFPAWRCPNTERQTAPREIAVKP